MKYAIIRTGGKQYKVTEGDVIAIEHLPSADKQVTFSDILLYANDSHVMIGTPIVADIVVSGSLLGDMKGEKIRVSKFKAKARYRRVMGHRQSLSQVKIDKIENKKESKVAKELASNAAAADESKEESKTVKKAASQKTTVK